MKPSVKSMIDALSHSELHECYNYMLQRLKLLHRADALLAMRDFQVFDRVYFDHSGKRHYGRIQKLNQKTISVITDDNEQWNCTPQNLHKVDTPATEEYHKKLKS